MRTVCAFIDQNTKYKVVASCCGHGKYPHTIVITAKKIPLIGIYHAWEIFSGTPLQRKRKFYKKDKEGFYFIPETIR
jgi:hypothetical protein